MVKCQDVAGTAGWDGAVGKELGAGLTEKQQMANACGQWAMEDLVGTHRAACIPPGSCSDSAP